MSWSISYHLDTKCSMVSTLRRCLYSSCMHCCVLCLISRSMVITSYHQVGVGLEKEAWFVRSYGGKPETNSFGNFLYSWQWFFWLMMLCRSILKCKMFSSIYLSSRLFLIFCFSGNWRVKLKIYISIEKSTSFMTLRKSQYNMWHENMKMQFRYHSKPHNIWLYSVLSSDNSIT